MLATQILEQTRRALGQLPLRSGNGFVAGSDSDRYIEDCIGQPLRS